MKTYYSIKEVSDLMNIPVSTLHYWEQEGLFRVHRNPDNNYREFSSSDVLNIWEITLYRDLNIPIEQVMNIIHNDMNSIDEIYTERTSALELEITALRSKLDRIQIQQSLIATVKHMQDQLDRLLSAPAPALECLIYSKPDGVLCIKDDFSTRTMKASLENTYNCGLFVSDTADLTDADIYTRVIFTEPDKCCPSDQIVWTASDSTYIEFLLKAELNCIEHNNIQQICEILHTLGLCTGQIIARYMLVADDNGIKTEYYKAWIEISPD